MLAGRVAGGILLAGSFAVLAACSGPGGAPEAIAAASLPRAAPATSDPVATSPATAPATGASSTTSTGTGTTSTSTTSTSTTSTSTTSASTTSTSTTTTVPLPPMTSCDRVVHIGDSTALFLWEPGSVGGAENTMEARYRAVGVDVVYRDNSGGRSIQERVASWQTNAFEVALAVREDGFTGCWVLMIGTNDAANVASGSSMGIEERINRMLFVIGDDPVLWVDAVTTRSTTGYRHEAMRAWNEVLYRIDAEREHMAVLRWTDYVRPEWFVSDGIHYGRDGRAWRAAITALALAESFPA